MIIGAQMYTLRDFCKTPEDLKQSLAKVADMGYRAVQLSGVCDYDAAWMKETLTSLGLTAPVTHIPAAKLQNELERVIADHDLIGIPYIGLGAAPGVFDKTKNCLDAFDALMEWLPGTVRRIKAAGHRFLYHNHDREFARDNNGKNFFERLCEAFTPAECGLLVDTYWAQAGGADPAQFLTDHAGRTPCIHFKDMSFDPVEHKFHMAPVGSGNLNWNRIFAVAADTGVEYAFIEQDHCYGEDPFRCLAQSLAFCRAYGFSG